MLIRLENVGFRHADNAIFEGFDLVVPKGGHRLLIGPSGSGKSTLINLICGFLRPTSGTIHVAGELISAGSEAERDAIRRRHIGVVFQTLRLVSAIDLMGNLLLASKLAGRGADRARADRLLHSLGLSDKARAMPKALSQGEAQRAAIARALMAKPHLLIADEPTSALDDRSTKMVADLLLEMSEANGATLLIATHDKRLRNRIDGVIELHAASVGGA